MDLFVLIILVRNKETSALNNGIYKVTATFDLTKKEVLMTMARSGLCRFDFTRADCA